jgi:hypothetical protein
MVCAQLTHCPPKLSTTPLSLSLYLDMAPTNETEGAEEMNAVNYNTIRDIREE